jgi:hypothetical protein
MAIIVWQAIIFLWVKQFNLHDTERVNTAGCQWLTPVILASYSGGRDQKDEVQRQFKKTLHKRGLAEWLKV